MLVTEIVPLLNTKSKNRLRVRLQDGAGFVLYRKEINRYDITEGEELEDAVYEEILREVFIPRARQRALHLLEKQDRTEYNLRTKLKESGYPTEAIENAILYVKDYNYINDERYAKNYIKYKSQTKSRKQIFNELALKGIGKDLAEKAYEDLFKEDDIDILSERDIIKNYISRKALKQDISHDKTQNKIYNHLLRKGFSSGDILSVMREVLC